MLRPPLAAANLVAYGQTAGDYRDQGTSGDSPQTSAIVGDHLRADDLVGVGEPARDVCETHPGEYRNEGPDPPQGRPDPAFCRPPPQHETEGGDGTGEGERHDAVTAGHARLRQRRA